MAQAYACRIKPSNFSAISSEHPYFNLEELHEWIKTHEDGYFIRDEDHRPFDCTYMDMLVFEEVYRFERFRADELFHPIAFR